MFKDEIQSLTTGDVFSSTIVIADDEPANRLLLERHLTIAGFTNLHLAENGKEALDLIREKAADLLILDIMMPVMDGFEVLETLRAEAEYVALPVLVQTALSSSEDRNRAFDAGATDLVTKPLNGREMISRVSIHLERQLMLNKLEEFHDRISEDLARAQTMQLALLPSIDSIGEIENKYSVRLESIFSPCNELGGDYWSVRPVNDDCFLLLLVDVSGHGVASSLNAALLHGISQEIECSGRTPGEVLSELNAQLMDHLPEGQFAAALCCMIDPARGKLSYAGASWAEPYILSADGSINQVLDGSGVPVGAIKGQVYPTQEISFAQGQSLVCYSDALIESTDTDGNMTGPEIVPELIAAVDPGEVDFLPRVMHEFHARVGTVLDDDLTVVVLHNHDGIG